MAIGDLRTPTINGLEITGSAEGDLIFGFLDNDRIDAEAGDDFVLGLFGDDLLSGGFGEDVLFGGEGDDFLVGNKGDDALFGGKGDDALIWNNGDGSDLMNGGEGHDRVQVNFDTDLVNDDLQNKDVAEFSATPTGVLFSGVEVNDQTEFGLFELDIRKAEVLETNFGDGEDAAVILGNLLEKIRLELDGGGDTDLLDVSQAAAAVEVDLQAGTAGSAQVENFENVIGSEFGETINGDKGENLLSGLGGEDTLRGRLGDDALVGNKGEDRMFGGGGDDLLVWNNGDGSDLMSGGRGDDRAQVNFDTDLVNDDLQNKDVAEISTTPEGVLFARVEVNDQTEFGLFELDIRKTEVLETNFGDGEDAAVILGDLLETIRLELDGGDDRDLLDFSQAAAAVQVDLDAGTAGTSTVVNFEDVTGSAFNDVILGDASANRIRGGDGEDILAGGAGEDDFVFFQDDVGTKVILDFEVGVDRLVFVTDRDLTAGDIVDQMTQQGSDVELEISGKLITIDNALVEDFGSDDFLIG
ncbi:MAG: iron-regulated protein frpC [Pseudomonadota bacterium]